MLSRLFIYNPTCELAIANGHVSYMPPSHLAQFEEDMASFSHLFATPDDFVLVSSHEKHAFDYLEETGFRMPRFVSSPRDLPSDLPNGLEFHPWGWSPSIYRQLKPFLPYAYAGWKNSMFQSWSSQLASLLSRETGYRLLKILRSLYAADEARSPSIKIPDDPIKISSTTELKDLLQLLSLPAVLKTPWSASGRGLYRVRHAGDDPVHSSWVKGMLQRQGKLYAENWLDKIQDVSFQFWLDANEIRYLGHNFFDVDSSGQFSGCVVGFPKNNHPRMQDVEWMTKTLDESALLIKKGLELMKLHHGYYGPVGVDAIFYTPKDSERVVLNPCVEMNLRYNMGLANLMLKPKIFPGSTGIWKTQMFPGRTWQAFCTHQSRLNPPVSEDGLLKSGFWPLVSPHSEKLFGAWLKLNC